MRHIRGFSLLCLALVRFCDYCSGSDTFFGSAPTTATRTSSVRGGSSSRSIIANNNDAAGRGLDEVTTTSSSAVVGDLSVRLYGSIQRPSALHRASHSFWLAWSFFPQRRRQVEKARRVRQSPCAQGIHVVTVVSTRRGMGGFNPTVLKATAIQLGFALDPETIPPNPRFDLCQRNAGKGIAELCCRHSTIAQHIAGRCVGVLFGVTGAGYHRRRYVHPTRYQNPNATIF